jgi:uncharacterized membrane protein YfcA
MIVDIWEIVVAFVAGTVGQVVDGSAGMGFGPLATTLLTVAGLAPAAAVATVNIAKVGSGISSGLSHWRFGNVRWSWVLPLAVPGVAGGAIGAFVFSRIPVESARAVIPWLLLGIGIVILARFARPRTPAPQLRGGADVAAIGDAPALALAAGGKTRRRARARVAARLRDLAVLGVGFLAGLVNAGTGSYGPVATSLLLVIRPARPRYVVGTVSLVEPVVAASAAAVLVAGIGATGVAWPVLGALVIGAIVAAPAAAYIARRVPARAMGITVGAVMVLLNGGVLLASAF